jgi:hypothetical protein
MHNQPMTRDSNDIAPSIGARGEGPQRQEPLGGGLSAGTTDPDGGLVGDNRTLDERSDYAPVGRAADGLDQDKLPPGVDSTRPVRDEDGSAPS